MSNGNDQTSRMSVKERIRDLQEQNETLVRTLGKIEKGTIDKELKYNKLLGSYERLLEDHGKMESELNMLRTTTQKETKDTNAELGSVLAKLREVKKERDKLIKGRENFLKQLKSLRTENTRLKREAITDEKA